MWQSEPWLKGRPQVGRGCRDEGSEEGRRHGGSGGMEVGLGKGDVRI